jgi:inhibitor of the pro-sigma K processing machinery
LERLTELLWSGPLPYLAGGLLLLILIFILRKPLRLFFRLARKTGIGLLALLALSKAGGIMGVSLGVNLLNSCVLGLLGLPGFGLLLLLRWVMMP